MAIPPVSNNPFLNLLGVGKKAGSGAQGGSTQDAPSRAATPQDIVEISRAAQQRLDDVRVLRDETEARTVAGETRDILETAPYNLGADLRA